ncbi:AAA family ATPase [Spirosoma luteum]|uniref:AAA family ATPase n=1 Tax=Spirosoma luteum TaxID=431553 RepID=UPI0003665A92|nr:ATP-binding protein [Spirosoma luteum]
MLRSLEIRNYRNLRHLTIEKLGRVNLLVGKNNTGKTSVLEALAIHAEQGNELPTIRKLLRKRGEFYPDFEKQNSSVESNLTTLKSLFTDRNTNFFISDEQEDKRIYIGELAGQDAYEILRIALVNSYAVSRSGENGNEYNEYVIATSSEQVEKRESRVEILLTRHGGIYQHRISLTDELLFSEHYFAKDNSSVFLQFVDAKNQTLETIPELWNKVALTESEDDVLKALQIIEPSIKRFSLVGDGRPIVRTGDGQRQALSSMGDGVGRVFSIILAAVNCESSGYLLIDEFENGLHYSVQEKLWEIIFYLAEKLNIQVFATTHSLDCIEAFSAVLNNGKQDLEFGTMIRLENYEGNIEATVYDANEIQSTTRVHVDPR